MIFQNPMNALDPLCPVFAQLIEDCYDKAKCEQKRSGMPR